MKRTQTRSILILLMTLAFFAGIAYHTVNLWYHSSQWVSQPQNAHLSDSNGLEKAGTIYDRNDVVLAQSVDGKRIYHEDEAVRKACLHVVGDDSTNISTAVQTVYRSDITGYHFIFGLGLPDAIKSGNNMKMTIDSKVQKAAYEALGNDKGAVFVYNYKTGEIICMASTPTYDPQNVPSDIETNDKYEGAYINRAISAAYAPGSTFKLVTSTAALNSIANVEKRTYDCDGHEKIGGKEINCFEPNGHLDFREALARSCNVYFARLAVDMGPGTMTKQAEKMGFNHKIVFDGIESEKSVYDVSKANTNDLAWSGVGQYTVLATPVNMAMISAAIANNGAPVQPYLIENIERFSGAPATEHKVRVCSAMMSKEIASKLYEMMDYTVETNYGKSSFSDTLDVCAKTGTAEVDDEGTSHAWVTGFCKDKEYPYAFAVVVEHGNSGFKTAIPVAASVLSSISD